MMVASFLLILQSLLHISAIWAVVKLWKSKGALIGSLFGMGCWLLPSLMFYEHLLIAASVKLLGDQAGLILYLNFEHSLFCIQLLTIGLLAISLSREKQNQSPHTTTTSGSA